MSSFIPIPTVPKLDLSAERYEVGDRAAFVKKANDRATKLAAWINAMQVSINSVNALGAYVEATQEQVGNEIDTINSTLETKLGNAVTSLDTLRKIGIEIQSMTGNIGQLRSDVDDLGIDDVEFLRARLDYHLEAIEAEVLARTNADSAITTAHNNLKGRVSILEGTLDLEQLADDVETIQTLLDSLGDTPEINVIPGLRAELDNLADEVSAYSYGIGWQHAIANSVELPAGAVVEATDGELYRLAADARGIDHGNIANYAALQGLTAGHGDTATLISDGKQYELDLSGGADNWVVWNGADPILGYAALDPTDGVTSWPSLASGLLLDTARPASPSADNGVNSYAIKSLATEMDQHHKYVIAENPSTISLQMAGQGPNYRVTLTSGATADTEIVLPEKFADNRPLQDGDRTAEIRFIPGAGMGVHRLKASSVSHSIEGDNVDFRIQSDEEATYRFVYSTADGWILQQWAALPFSPFIFPQRYGCSSSSTNNTSAFNDMLDDLPVGKESTIFIDREFIFRKSVILFPREGTSGRNANLLGHSGGSNALTMRGDADGAFAWAAYSVNDTDPGHTAGTPEHGGVIRNMNFVANNNTLEINQDRVLHIGLCAHLTTESLRVYGGKTGLQLWQVADPTFIRTTVSGEWVNTYGDNTLMDIDYGSNSVHMIDFFFQKYGKRALKIGSNRTDSAGAVPNGPGKCRFFMGRFDQAGSDISEHVLIESGSDNSMDECRMNTGGRDGDPEFDQPFFRITDVAGDPGPNTGLYVDPATSFTVNGGILRAVEKLDPVTGLPIAGESSSDTSYIVQNDATAAIGSSNALILSGVKFENLKPAAGDLYRGIGDKAIARMCEYRDCNSLTETDRVVEYEMMPKGLKTLIQRQRWIGNISIRRSNTAMALQIARAGYFGRINGDLHEEVEVAAVDPVELYPLSRDGSIGTATTTIDPTQFENPTLTAATSGNATVQRLYYDPSNDRFLVQWGQRQYANISTATEQALSDDKYVVHSSAVDYVLLAFIVVMVDATSLASSADCRFIQTEAGR